MFVHSRAFVRNCQLVLDNGKQDKTNKPTNERCVTLIAALGEVRRRISIASFVMAGGVTSHIACVVVYRATVTMVTDHYDRYTHRHRPPLRLSKPTIFRFLEFIISCFPFSRPRRQPKSPSTPLASSIPTSI